jgi:hypothetical protein
MYGDNPKMDLGVTEDLYWRIINIRSSPGLAWRLFSPTAARCPTYFSSGYYREKF